MIATPIRILYVPMPYNDGNSAINSSNYYAIEETVAWLGGEGASRSGVDVGLVEDESDIGYDIDSLLSDSGYPIPDLPVDDYFSLIGSDDEEVKEAVASLRRRFQLIDDFISDFPDERSMSLPFPGSTIYAAVFCEKVSLASVDPCLCHLNPKSSMYYFYFDTKGCKSERLVELARLCSDDEVSSVINARREQEEVDLPRNGVGINFLAHILWMCKDVENMENIFSKYPSFLTIFYITTKDWVQFDHLILTIDYGMSLERCRRNELDTCALTIAILGTLGRVKTKGDAERVVSMLNPQKNSQIIAPYFVSLDHYTYNLIGGMKSSLENGAKLLGVEYKDLKKRLME